MKIQEKYLSRCIQIAKNGLGSTAPNPMVGAVIVHEDRIIGEGFTSPFGGPHAEVNAIRSAGPGELLRDATLYVTLEPCCHHGKTPPCTDLIIASGIRRVVIGIEDPNDKVSGKGVRVLKEAGCEVHTGILEPRCREHHRRFLTFHQHKRPYIILKWAESKDGYIAPDPSKRKSEPEPFWISGKRSRQLVHKWRTEEAGILVGWRTAAADNPHLTSRDWEGKNPLRVLLDPGGNAPGGLHLFDGTVPTLRFCREGVPSVAGAENIRVPGPDSVTETLLRELHLRGIMSVIVEGGARTLTELMEAGMWDEARVFSGPSPMGSGIKAPDTGGRLKKEIRVGSDILKIWRND